jgi:hypothetical protein
VFFVIVIYVISPVGYKYYRMYIVMYFFYFSFVLMLLRYCFANRNRKRRDIIIILKIVKFNFLILTDTVVSRQTADVTLGGILQLNGFEF